MRIIKIHIVLLLVLFFSSCDENTYPRPRGNVRLEYPTAQYSLYNSEEIKMSFNKSDYAIVEKKNDNWINLAYPKMRAKVHLSYFNVDGNITSLINDINKLTDEHKIKASGIIPHEYSNSEEKVYGVVYEIIGNSASNIQFYATDSTKHIISGSLYFRSKPNSDSLAPAIQYVKQDIITLLESLKWDE
ncbi:MAG: gliding motility lipoprotein GldD [Flavobacteriales bacterium]|nr:gliding motility lipoprotein GldD [Flavobacteriales bacterium]